MFHIFNFRFLRLLRWLFTRYYAPVKDYAKEQLTTFAEAHTIVETFEDDMRSLGLSIVRGSPLELVCLHILDLESKRTGNSSVDLSTDCRPAWRRIVGLVPVLKLLHHARSQGVLGAFAPHLRLLNRATETQNARILSDDACNKLFEMLVGLFCVPIADSIELDDPDVSQGDNPDVLATIDGNLWGFACKTPNGSSPKTMFERLQEGVEQIERSKAEKGIVFFNFRNVIDHEATWPGHVMTKDTGGSGRFNFRIWPDSSPVEEYFKSLADQKNRDILAAIGVENVVKYFRGKKSMPGAMVFLQSATAVNSIGGPFVTTVGIPAIMEFGRIEPSDMNILQRMQYSRLTRFNSNPST